MANPTRTVTSQPLNGQVIPVETPTNIHALLEFVNGATITLSASWDVWSHRHANMELYGTEGSIYVPDPNFFGGIVEASGRDKDIQPLENWAHPFGVSIRKVERPACQLPHCWSRRYGAGADRGTRCPLLARPFIAWDRCHDVNPQVWRGGTFHRNVNDMHAACRTWYRGGPGTAALSRRQAARATLPLDVLKSARQERRSYNRVMRNEKGPAHCQRAGPCRKRPFQDRAAIRRSLLLCGCYRPSQCGIVLSSQMRNTTGATPTAATIAANATRMTRPRFLPTRWRLVASALVTI